jgi:5-methyltetrahydropteroyltriglutamate--homocysteine methyltransferase
MVCRYRERGVPGHLGLSAQPAYLEIECLGSVVDAGLLDLDDYSYKSVLPYLDRLDVDIITFETADNNGAEIAEIAAAVSSNKKICIGVVSHRTLQVEMPEDVATLIREALKYIAPERLILSSDCGFGRQGMSRIHAFYKMIAIVRGANIVRHELGLPQTEILAADPRFAWI